jgi:polysaccharide export outer membrane protein
MPVRPDGHISLPLIGEVQAAGLTASELQEQIQQRLQVYMSHPQVNVIVQEIRSRSFNIIGKVIKPGAYDLKKPTTVLDGIAQGGGFQDFARITKIYVLRRAADGSTAMLPFNYKQAIKGNSLNQNVELVSGDTIVVP